jgi:glycosyltransferase involved in cell wall biosynthesis
VAVEESMVTVIVATHNRGHYLAAFLESALLQDYEGAFELLVVDNGSTDETAAILEQWSNRDNRIRPLHQPVLGKSRAQNLAIESARGDLLLFTDDDVILDPGWIRHYALFFRSAGSQLVLAGGTILPVAMDLDPWPYWLSAAGVADVPTQLDHGPRRRLDEDFEYVWGANLGLTARSFDLVGPWDVDLGPRGDRSQSFPAPRVGKAADAFYNDRVRAAGGAVWFLPEPVVHHRVRREEVTPRRILTTAFGRGRQESAYFTHVGWHWERPEAADRLTKGLLSRHLFVWWHLNAAVGWAIAFGLIGRADWFEKARRSAWLSGWVIQSLADENGALSPLVARASALLRRLALVAVGIRHTSSRAPRKPWL